MGKMKELYTIGQELQANIKSDQICAPAFEEFWDMQQRCLQVLRIAQNQYSAPARLDQDPLF